MSHFSLEPSHTRQPFVLSEDLNSFSEVECERLVAYTILWIFERARRHLDRALPTKSRWGARVCYQGWRSSSYCRADGRLFDVRPQSPPSLQGRSLLCRSGEGAPRIDRWYLAAAVCSKVRSPAIWSARCTGEALPSDGTPRDGVVLTHHSPARAAGHPLLSL